MEEEAVEVAVWVAADAAAWAAADGVADEAAGADKANTRTPGNGRTAFMEDVHERVWLPQPG